MGKHSAIEWTDHTFNPWWGCVRVSPACVHCYAETWSKRIGLALWGPGSPRRFFTDQHWRQPVLWNRSAEKENIRRRVFCASMADVFELRADLDDQRTSLWDLILKTPNLDWLLLTKRPENVRKLVPWTSHWPNNVWLGATVENQEWAERRIPFLIEAGAHICFLSCEPLLGPVNLSRWLHLIHWVIVGGESGRQAQPLQPEWVSSILEQTLAARVAFHFKQWGEWRPIGNQMKRIGKKNAGRIFHGRTWDDLPVPVERAISTAR